VREHLSSGSNGAYGDWRPKARQTRALQHSLRQQVEDLPACLPLLFSGHASSIPFNTAALTPVCIGYLLPFGHLCLAVLPLLGWMIPPPPLPWTSGALPRLDAHASACHHYTATCLLPAALSYACLSSFLPAFYSHPICLVSGEGPCLSLSVSMPFHLCHSARATCLGGLSLSGSQMILGCTVKKATTPHHMPQKAHDIPRLGMPRALTAGAAWTLHGVPMPLPGRPCVPWEGTSQISVERTVYRLPFAGISPCRLPLTFTLVLYLVTPATPAIPCYSIHSTTICSLTTATCHSLLHMSYATACLQHGGGCPPFSLALPTHACHACLPPELPFG